MIPRASVGPAAGYDAAPMRPTLTGHVDPDAPVDLQTGRFAGGNYDADV